MAVENKEYEGNIYFWHKVNNAHRLCMLMDRGDLFAAAETFRRETRLTPFAETELSPLAESIRMKYLNNDDAGIFLDVWETLKRAEEH